MARNALQPGSGASLVGIGLSALMVLFTSVESKLYLQMAIAWRVPFSSARTRAAVAWRWSSLEL